MEIGQKITLRNGRKVEIVKKLNGGSYVIRYKWPEGEGGKVASQEELINGVLDMTLLDASFQQSVMPTIMDKRNKKNK